MEVPDRFFRRAAARETLACRNADVRGQADERPLQPVIEPGAEPVETDPLHKEIVDTRCDARLDEFGGIIGGHEHDREALQSALHDALRKRIAGEARHVEVGDQQVRLLLDDALEGRLAVAKQRHLISCCLDRATVELGDQPLVVDEDDFPIHLLSRQSCRGGEAEEDEETHRIRRHGDENR